MNYSKFIKRPVFAFILACTTIVSLHVMYKPFLNSALFAKYIDSSSSAKDEKQDVSEVSKYNDFNTSQVRSTPVTPRTDKYKHTCLASFSNCVRIFDTSVDYSQVKQIHKCVALRIPSLANTPICVYDPKIDIYVSKSIITGGNWEGGNILTVIEILRRNPNLLFLDLGCNVGVYTLSIAKTGRKVIALDANRKNLEMLTTSLRKGNLTNMVTLIWNALSDKAETVGFKEDLRNIGGLQMLSGVSDADAVSEEKSSVSIVLDDLVPMFRNKSLFIKMDIETYELKAMLGGKIFFKEVDIKFLFMEWFHHKDNDVGTRIIQFMTERGYKPFNPLQTSFPLQIENRKSWSGDIVWIK
ncbi:hypothetical protein DPMN_064022 [Dreissena polymorpha]|uniref:Methyltransferase FkbM domain-containing protein n=1 Tax=Dreissena polymorpha TaxID=45954 RepID=A0A9D4CBK0_DREPO|nr:hypothetical protein DPMN_064022 [Dreissena polymorpha]